MVNTSGPRFQSIISYKTSSTPDADSSPVGPTGPPRVLADDDDFDSDEFVSMFMKLIENSDAIDIFQMIRLTDIDVQKKDNYIVV